MAEVLGAVSSAVTLLQLAAKVNEYIRDIKKCPFELAAINNEVDDIRLLVCQIQVLADDDLTLDTFLSRPLYTTIERLKAVDRFLILAQGAPKATRVQWARKKSDLHRLRGDLQDSRQQISAALSLTNAKSIFRLSVQFDALRNQLLHEFTQTRMSVDSTTNAILYDSRRSNSTYASNECASRDQSTSTGLQPRLLGAPYSPAGAVDTDTVFRVPVNVAQPTFKKCFQSCPCSCHRCTTVRPLRYGIMGYLSIGFAGLSNAAWGCSSSSCLVQGRRYVIQLQYLFPKWLLRKAMDLHLLYEHSNQLSVSITVRNVLPWDDEWIVALMANDVQSLQAILQVSPSRINDINQAGESAIEWAIAHWRGARNPECLDLFVRAGAKVTSDSPVVSELVFDYVQGAGGWPGCLPIIQLQEALCNLPYIHKATINKAIPSLEDHMNQASHEINLQDEFGRTALWWAVALGNIRKVREVLRRGASVNLSDCHGFSPISAACSYLSDRVVQNRILDLLMSQGPELTETDRWGNNALHFTGAIEDEESRMRLYNAAIRQGADVNARNILGCTPLHIWPLMSAASFEMLVGAGASVNTTPNVVGQNLLMRCIIHKNSEIAALCLRYEVDYLYRDYKFNTILHHTAMSAHRGVIRVFRAHGLTGINVHAKNKRGFTALDYIRYYCHDEAVREEFYALIDQIIFGKRFEELDITQQETPIEEAAPHLSDDDIGDYSDDTASEYESAPEDLDNDSND